jgi:cysteine desulfurase
MKTPVYLDNNATIPHDPDVITGGQPYLTEYFGNPFSSYLYGIQTKEAVEKARRQVDSLLHCDLRRLFLRAEEPSRIIML